MSLVAPGIEVAHLGTSTEGRPLRAVKFGPLNPVSYAPAIFIVAGQHAREWGAVGVGMELLFLLEEVLAASGAVRPDLYQALQDGSVVVMPLANPDGYEHSRNHDRMWRGNKSSSCPNGGVNLNRNHEATWGVPAMSAADSCNPVAPRDDSYGGPSPQSEPETESMDRLVEGWSFELPESPIAVWDLHTYSDLLVYPSGVKSNPDSDGPACEMLKSNCISADHGALRELFGNTYSHRATPAMFVDPGYTPGLFRRDQGPNIIYTASGTLLDQAAYGNRNPHALSMTVELFSQDYRFSIECATDHDTIIKNMTTTVMDGLEQVLHHGASLLETSASSSFFPVRRGILASGYYARDYPLGTSSEDVRATFLKPIWRELDTFNMTVAPSTGGPPQNLSRWRQGVAYNLYALPLANTGSELCLPCEMHSFVPGTDLASSDMVPECSGCLDLCDPGRQDVTTSGWRLADGARGTSRDCWWQPDSPGDLRFSGQSSPFFSSHCTFSVSLEIATPGALKEGSLRLLREDPAGGEELIWDSVASTPYAPLPSSNQVFTLLFEADELLSINSRTPSFRFIADDYAAQAGVRVFDPVTICRIGMTP